MNEQQWFYEANGEQAGPVSWESLMSGLHDGSIDETTQVWAAHLPDWTPLGQCLPVSQPPVMPATPAAPTWSLSHMIATPLGRIVAGVLGLILLGIITFIAIPAVLAHSGDGKYGRTVPCAINTVGDESGNTLYNARFINPQAFIDEKAGTLTIKFDYEATGVLSGTPLVCHFLVREFDKNGQYLAHFTTREQYVSHGVVDLGKVPPQVAERYREVSPKNNLLQYPINMRDAAFITSIEFGATTRN